LTPNIDRLTTLGVSFTNAWATSSWSLPTQATILTGRYPHEHGADWPGFVLSAPTLSEYFARRGYVTGAFSGNAAWITPEYLERGFVRFEVYRFEDLLRRTAYGRILDRLLRGVGLHSAGRGKKAPAVNAGFADFIEDYGGRPFFAYLCYMDVNQAFHHRRLNRGFWQRPATSREVVDAYEHGLRAVDAEIGNLIDDLARRRLLERTLIVLTSDHGESFGAHETDDHDPPGHGTSLYAEQTKIPLSIVYPAKVPAGRRVNRAVSQRDIPATILQALGLAESPFGGQTLLRHVDDVDDIPPRPVLATLYYEERNMRSVIWDRWQYIHDRRRDPQGEELFDLEADPLAIRSMFSPDGRVALGRSRLMLDELLRQAIVP
jgi:arylsulfatase A-like enzyme